jgi:hypothetical protein
MYLNPGGSLCMAAEEGCGLNDGDDIRKKDLELWATPCS